MLRQTVDSLIAPIPKEYPNHLAAPGPESPRLERRTGLLVGLVALCLILRLAMAWRIPAISPDSALYLQIARGLETGQAVDRQFQANTYPVILVALHRLGLDWETGGVVWGVAVSCLTVLPLYGWVRRQFDDRVALIACVLYATHPTFIAWSPEIIRDSTFWFLFTLSLYLLWRAVVEVHRPWFAVAGVLVTLAIGTRFEGLFLLIPFSAWTFWRFLGLKEARGRLLAGVALGVFVFPSLLVVANAARHLGREGWVVPRTDPLRRVQSFVTAIIDPSKAVDAEGTLPPEARLSPARMLRVFFATMTRGLSPIFALLMFGGMWGWRGVWARRDHQVLFVTAMVLVGGIWIQMWCDRNICPRYALPIVLMAAGFSALGLLGLTARILRGLQWLWPEFPGRRVAAAVPLLVATSIGAAVALTSQQDYLASRKAAKELGRWIGQEFAASAVLAGPAGVTPIVSHYAHGGTAYTYRADVSDETTVWALVQRRQPDLLILAPTKRMDVLRTEALVKHLQGVGFVQIEPPLAQLPESPMALLRCRGASSWVAGFPSSQQSR